MINQGNNVPDNTIAIFADRFDVPIAHDRIKNMVSKTSKTRDWFIPHFYRCLPLVIGNQYGFVLKAEFDFSVEWDGGEGTNAIKIYFNNTEEEISNVYPRLESRFGQGILTINPPFSLRTPPGVNLMTINPPNEILPNITVMTGVVESDNLRRNFTFNIKLQMPNQRVFFPAGTSLAAFLPIPRYFGDQFELKMAEDVFNESVIVEELIAAQDAYEYRNTVEPTLPNRVGRSYFRGEDVYGNKFPDHQI